MKLQRLIGGNPNRIKKHVRIESGEQMDQRYEADRIRHAGKRKKSKLELDRVRAEMNLEQDVLKAKAIVLQIFDLNGQTDRLLLEAEKFKDCPVCFKGYRYFSTLESFAHRERCIREGLYKKYRCSKTHHDLASCFSNVQFRQNLARTNHYRIWKLEEELRALMKQCHLCLNPRRPCERYDRNNLIKGDRSGNRPERPGIYCTWWEEGKVYHSSEIEQWDEIPFGPFLRWEEESYLYS